MKVGRRCAAWCVAALGIALWQCGESPAAEGAAPVPPDARPAVVGQWKGAKLRCQKEENKLVRCGTPVPFVIAFEEGGAGSSPDENFPDRFSWRWLSPQEIAVRPEGGGEELKLFGVELESDMLTFQAYVYLPTADPNLPAEARYLHFIFDVSRSE